MVDWLDKILRNTLDGEAVEIDGARFAPGELKGATLAVAGGAQFGKTVLELNLMAYATAIRFLSVGNYLPDRPKVEEIVGQKFRPNVLDLYPWMAEMIQLGKAQNASGKTIDRKESYTVTDGERKSFGNFCGMHKPPTSITIDLALLDEVDDIPERNIGYVDARMTNSPVHLTCFIGTQRLAGAGQNARLKASSFHVRLVPCPGCGREWCLEDEFPRCVRVRPAAPQPDPPGGPPCIYPEMGFDRLARYYLACPECGADWTATGRYVARHPERIRQARLGVRVSQLNISAIPLEEIVGAWYAAFEDPGGNALAAFAATASPSRMPAPRSPSPRRCSTVAARSDSPTTRRPPSPTRCQWEGGWRPPARDAEADGSVVSSDSGEMCGVFQQQFLGLRGLECSCLWYA